MTTASPTKTQERLELLDSYSQGSVLTADATDLDMFAGMFAFDCDTEKAKVFIDRIEWVAEKYLSPEVRRCTFAGLNIGDQRYVGKDFDERIKAVADQIVDRRPATAMKYWRKGITIIAKSYDKGMLLKQALELIRDPATPPAAAEMLRWLTDDYIDVNGLT